MQLMMNRNNFIIHVVGAASHLHSNSPTSMILSFYHRTGKYLVLYMLQAIAEMSEVALAIPGILFFH
jgi:hypothetical protein